MWCHLFPNKHFLSLTYLAVALAIAPFLTLSVVVLLGGFSFLFRQVLELGYDIGDRVADTNERIQQAVQSGTQGIRDAKLFFLKDKLRTDFLNAVDQFTRSSIKSNQHAITSFYNLLTAISVFTLIYVTIEFADLSLSALGVFLFAMFRLGPITSNLNSQLYSIENVLPHLVRTQAFIDELERNREPDSDGDVPPEIRTVAFDDVRFGYEGQDEDALTVSPSSSKERSSSDSSASPEWKSRRSSHYLLACMNPVPARFERTGNQFTRWTSRRGGRGSRSFDRALTSSMTRSGIISPSETETFHKKSWTG